MHRRKIMKNKQEIVVDKNAEWQQEIGWDKMTVEERISYLVKNEKYNVHVNIDPPTYKLNKMDYLRKNPVAKIKTAFANFLAKNYIEKMIKSGQLRIKKIVGLENLQNIDGGAILTCNHFNPFDNFAVQKVFEKVKKPKQKMWKIILEGNYTNPPCLSFFFKNCDTFPLGSNIHVMGEMIKSVNTVLDRGDYILIYPEEAMWPNYKTPRPLRDGAFNFAVKANKPVVPIFITLEDSEVLDQNGQPLQDYTVHVLPAIYPKSELSRKENIEYMKNANFDAWKQVYEDFYGKELEY